MSAAYVSAIVAGVAVIVSALLQYLTLQRAKEDSIKTLTASARTARLAALADATNLWEQGLREDLATYATLVYEVETAWQARTKGSAWPGPHYDKVLGIETIFNRVMLRLDREIPTESALIKSAKAMRDDETTLWVTRRDNLVVAAAAAFRARWAGNLAARTDSDG
jgi:hypothetical protein